jgi:diguanylate cyclase (GGDEF)-like protein
MNDINDMAAQILIVDDTPQNLDLLSDTLSGLDVRLKVATSGERAVELATRQPPDLILLDVMMPGMDGFETCRRLKADARTAEVPVIFVTARHEDVAQGFAVGGADYLTKPIQADEVRARVRHQLERRAMLRELQTLNRLLEDKVRERTAELTLVNRQLREEINERRYMQDRLNYLATHDFVTRLFNRSALDAHVSEVLARVQRERTEAVFLLIDLDQFRMVNETCGFIAGDELLRGVADALSGLLSRGDMLARVGGDRFAIVSEQHVAEQGRALARLVQQQIEGFVFDWDGRSFHFAASLAVVPLHDDIVSFDQVMLMADETMYLAKQEGRGTVRSAPLPVANGQAPRERTNWALVLMDALRLGHFQVFVQRLQPLTAERAAEGLRLEALIRLWDPQRGQLVLPGQFIPPAERFHMVADLDRWMLQEVIGFLGRETALHPLLGYVAVNLSAVSMREPGLAAFVLDLLDRHGVPPSLLCIEITETSAIVNLALARDFMQGLRARGCRFSLDDFGSGFASYGYLRELPFDALKIDGVFVRDMEQDDTHAAMVRSMVEMARLLGHPVVAECVESAAVAERLMALGVDWAQGFHFHRPEPHSAELIVRQAEAAAAAVPAEA